MEPETATINLATLRRHIERSVADGGIGGLVAYYPTDLLALVDAVLALRDVVDIGTTEHDGQTFVSLEAQHAASWLARFDFSGARA